jgi:hypothetical protein
VRAPLWCACVGSLLPVQALVLLHKLAVHHNTEGIKMIGTHTLGIIGGVASDAHRMACTRHTGFVFTESNSPISFCFRFVDDSVSRIC